MPKAPKQPSLMMLTETGSPMVEIFKMNFENGNLILDAKALDSMRMNVLVTPEAIATVGRSSWPTRKPSWLLRKDACGVEGSQEALEGRGRRIPVSA